ncbi:MAG: hypothetical protein WBA97_26555 [Actinophytocola sp.]
MERRVERRVERREEHREEHQEGPAMTVAVSSSQAAHPRRL